MSFSDPAELGRVFHVDRIATDPLPPRYNVAPTSEIYAVIERDDRALGRMRWGFIPHWATEPSPRAPINARVETADRRPMFRDAFIRRRCIVPADGFYEWQRLDPDRPGSRRRSRPYYLHDPSGRPLAFAGLWSVWRPAADAEPVVSCAILTQPAPEELRWLHDRVPVILPEDAWDPWLDPEQRDPRAVRALLSDLPPPVLEVYEVAPRVNDVRNEGPELIARAS